MNGWPLLGVTTALSLLAFGGVVSIAGTGEDGIRLLVRVTVRIAFFWFLLAYTASSLWKLFPNAATRWLLRNRRQLGLSFFVAHVLHLDAIWMLSLLLGDAFRTPLPTLVFGGASYVLAAAMALTSFDRTAAWLGPRRWNALHRTGLHVLWVIFAFQWAGLAFVHPAYASALVLTFAALGVRLAAKRRHSAAQDPVATPA